MKLCYGRQCKQKSMKFDIWSIYV